MSTEKNKALIREYLETMSRYAKDPTTVDRYISDEDLKNHIEVFETAFPGYQMILEDMMAEGDKVAVRFKFIGTHKGIFQEFLPTGREVSMKGIIIYEIKNNKIINHWMGADTAELISQLHPESNQITT